MNGFANIVRRAAKTARRTFGVKITYTTVDGVVIGPFCATVGNGDYMVEEAGGVQVLVTTRDYIIDAADLASNGTLIEPKRGDSIAEAGYTYKVTLGDSRAAPWKWSDSTRTIRRVHCDQTGVPA
jgi:hypothetical protein